MHWEGRNSCVGSGKKPTRPDGSILCSGTATTGVRILTAQYAVYPKCESIRALGPWRKLEWRCHTQDRTKTVVNAIFDVLTASKVFVWGNLWVFNHELVMIWTLNLLYDRAFSMKYFAFVLLSVVFDILLPFSHIFFPYFSRFIIFAHGSIFSRTWALWSRNLPAFAMELFRFVSFGSSTVVVQLVNYVLLLRSVLQISLVGQYFFGQMWAESMNLGML